MRSDDRILRWCDDAAHYPSHALQGAKREADPPPTMKRYYTQALWLDHQAGMHVAQ